MVQFQGADDFFETAAAGGNAMRLKDIKGIGEATANKIYAVRGVDTTDDITKMSADELADKANISRSRAQKAISGLGGNPSVSKTRSNTGSVSAAGMRTRQGDFWVEFTEMDKARAKNDARSRSPEAVKADETQRAPITTNLETWKGNPARWDFPAVDTPTQEPGVRPKDYKAGGEFDTAEFDESGQAEYDEQGDEYPKKKAAASGKENFILQTEEDRIPASEVTDRQDFDPFGVEAEARDVSLSPDEAIRGVGLGAPSAPGGQAYNSKLGRPVETDRIDQEQEPPEEAVKKQSRGGGPNPVDLPKETLGVLQTELNKKVFEEDRNDLRELRQKTRRAKGFGGKSKPLPLSSSEHAEVTEMLRERKEEAEDRAERMDANIFGSTEDQADMARQAYRGVVNNPPSY